MLTHITAESCDESQRVPSKGAFPVTITFPNVMSWNRKSGLLEALLYLSQVHQHTDELIVFNTASEIILADIWSHKKPH